MKLALDLLNDLQVYRLWTKFFSMSATPEGHMASAADLMLDTITPAIATI